jgi:MFS family permease
VIALLGRNREFRKLWTAQVVSQAGDWLSRIATLQLLELHGGVDAAVLGIGLLFAVEHTLRLLPSALLGPLAGPVADRLPRKLVLVFGDAGRALLVLGYLFVDSSSELWLVYVLVLLQMGASAFFDAARQGVLPNTVGVGDLHGAIALSAATWSAMLSLGSLAGGIIVANFGSDTAFAIDASTYALSALLVSTLRLPPQPRQPERLRFVDVVTGRDLLRALDHVRGLGISVTLLAKVCWGGAGGLMVLLALAPRTHYGGGSELAFSSAYGYLLAARGVGTAVGPYLARRFLGTSPRALVRTVGCGFVAAPLFYAGFGATDTLWLAALCVGLAHTGGGAIWVASTSLWQRRVDDRFRGRVHALDYLWTALSFSFFSLAAGVLYDAGLSFQAVTWCMCAAVALLGALWWRGAAGLED